MSLLLLANWPSKVFSAQRPRYGGILHMDIAASVNSLDPLSPDDVLSPESEARARLLSLVLEGLTRLDASGQPVPALAKSWRHDASETHWTFVLRPNVHFSDGALLTPSIVATSLSPQAGWLVSALSDSIVIETNVPDPDVPFELALPEHLIRRGEPGEIPVGTGPFRVIDWKPGHHMTFQANEAAWSGRPFLDGVEVRLSTPWKQENIDFQVGKADAVEIPPEDARQIVSRGGHLATSAPRELLCIVFLSGSGIQSNPFAREALAGTVNRNAIWSFLLQKEGVVAASILPQWMSGTAFLFSTDQDLSVARDFWVRAGSRKPLVLLYGPDDKLVKAVADRIAVGARVAGIAVTPQPDTRSNRATANALLVRWVLPSPDPRLSLAAVQAQIVALSGLSELPISTSASSEDLFGRERDILDSFWVVPLAHLPQVVALGPPVHDWMQSQTGDWPLADVWVAGNSQ